MSTHDAERFAILRQRCTATPRLKYNACTTTGPDGRPAGEESVAACPRPRRPPASADFNRRVVGTCSTPWGSGLLVGRPPICWHAFTRFKFTFRNSLPVLVLYIVY